MVGTRRSAVDSASTIERPAFETETLSGANVDKQLRPLFLLKKETWEHHLVVFVFPQPHILCFSPEPLLLIKVKPCSYLLIFYHVQLECILHAVQSSFAFRGTCRHRAESVATGLDPPVLPPCLASTFHQGTGRTTKRPAGKRPCRIIIIVRASSGFLI